MAKNFEDYVGRCTPDETLELVRYAFSNLTEEVGLEFIVDELKASQMLRGEVLALFEDDETG